jgi:hypothetical protein
MINTLAAPGPQIPEQSAIRGYQSLSQASEQRSITQNAEAVGETRQRMSSTLNIGEERNLIDATKDIAANLFNAFRNEMREALNHVGIRGEAAADLVRDVGKAFIESVRGGTSFSFSMIAVAYKETITQTATTMSHALEFSANALSLEYNHATGEITADTTKMQMDAVKVVQSDNLPTNAAASLFDFTDSDGPPSIASIFDRVQQYLVNNGFVGEESEDDATLPPVPTMNEALYDAILVNDKKAEEPEAEAPTGEEAANPFEKLPTETTSPDSLRIQAVEEFTNGRQETITRMTFDLVVRVYLGKEAAEPEVITAQNREDETIEIYA